MLFNSILFLYFFALVFALRYALPVGWGAHKAILLVASILFYGAWRPEYLLLILISTLIDWWASRAMDAAPDQPTRRRYLLVSLCSNLGMLAFFKYTNFAVDNVNLLSTALGGDQLITPPNILLPVGISFYTFQTLSYTIDVYRGHMKPWRSFWDFALFVTFFPQLVAGPIVRAVDFEEQCVTPRPRDWSRIAWGLMLAVWGLTQKIVLSDGYLASVADAAYKRGAQPGALDAWMGTLAFSGQIYFDFAGYSLCAIGLAIALGFDLPKNFHAPYAALGFSDFWRRWHISLSSWLRDYLYISLGGNRGSAQRTYFNLFMTMLLGGLWHGASWNFVIWGAMHGAFLIAERLLRPRLDALGAALGRVSVAIGWLATYLLVCLTWVPFRAPDLAGTLAVWRGMIGLAPASRLIPATSLLYAAVVLGGMLLGHWLMRERELGQVAKRLPAWALGALIAACLLLIILHAGSGNAFIYFQF